MTASLIIAGRVISIATWLDYTQTIAEPLGGRVDRRLANGQLFTIARWKKYKVTLSASGWAPAALLGIDWSGDVVVELPRPLALAPGDDLPPGFSARDAPWNEQSTVDSAGHPLRLVWPKFTARSPGPSTSSSSANGWELVLEQS